MEEKELKIGDYVTFDERFGRVNKIKNGNALCRFFGFTKWIPIKDLKPAKEGDYKKGKKK